MADRKSGNLDPAIVSFFMSKGYTEAQAKGIAAGIFAESANNPKAVNPDSGALGLGQWIGPRKKAIIEQYGPNPSKKDQLEFLHYELQGGDAGGKAVLKAKTATGVLNAYVNDFMRPAKGTETTGDINRGMRALGLSGDSQSVVPEWKTKPRIERTPTKSTFEIIQERRARKAAEQGSDLTDVYNAYKQGLMSQDEAAQYEKDVQSGSVMMPRGGTLNRAVASYTLPREVIAAYNSYAMSDEERAQVDQDLQDGVVSLPKGVQLQRPAPRTSGELVGMGIRDIMTGAGGLVDVVAGPLNAIVNALPGEQGLSTSPTTDLANQLADKLGLARPESETEQLQSAIIGGATQGLLTSGLGLAAAPARGLPALTKTQMIGEALAANPALDIVAGSTSAGSAELARQSGAGPVGQFVAGLAGGAVPVAGAAAAGRIKPSIIAKTGPKVGASVDEIIADIPPRVLIDEAGKITSDGVEIATRHGINPDEIAAAAVRKQTAPEAPAVEVPKPAEVPVEAAPEVTAKPITEMGAAATERLARAESEQIPLTRGQATQEFAIQDAEQTLRAATGKEADQARAFLADQSEKIKSAVDRLQTTFGDTTLNAVDRGQIVKDAIRELRDQGKAGVNRLYNVASELGGDQLNLDTQGILETARSVLIDEGVPEAVRKSIKQQLGKYKIAGTAGKINEVGETKITFNDGSSVTILGEPQPLTLGNAEEFRQAINRLYLQDTTKLSQGIKSAIDDSVERALESAPAGELPAVREARIAARKAYAEQKAIFSAKDIVQRIIDFKKGTQTDVMLPERTIPEILGAKPDSITNLKKIKAVLLSKPTEESLNAWKAIKAQGVSDIFEKAYTTNANLGGGQVGAFSGAKLNSAIEQFGMDKLNVLLDQEEFKRLMRLKAIIGDATIPISGTTNPSGTSYKLIKYITQTIGTVKGIPFVGQTMDAASTLYNKVKQLSEMQDTLRNMTDYTPEVAAAEVGAKPSTASSKVEAMKAKADALANEIVQDFFEISPRLVVPIISAKPDEGESMQ